MIKQSCSSMQVLLSALHEAGYFIQKNPAKYGYTYDPFIQLKTYGNSKTNHLYYLLNELGVEFCMRNVPTKKGTKVRIKIGGYENLGHLMNKLWPAGSTSDKVNEFKHFIDQRVKKLAGNGKARYDLDEDCKWEQFKNKYTKK